MAGKAGTGVQTWQAQMLRQVRMQGWFGDREDRYQIRIEHSGEVGIIWRYWFKEPFCGKRMRFAAQVSTRTRQGFISVRDAEDWICEQLGITIGEET
jgi:hypothetical protein